MPDEREIRLYYFTAPEAAELVHCGVDFIWTHADAVGGVRRRNPGGGRPMIMLPPSAIGELKTMYQRGN